jgi:glycosyltransferase involved in cell wall biosynthesis
MSDPSVSVIVPCYRHAEPLRRCLLGLSRERQGDGFETIVVNVSADPAVAALVAEFPGVVHVATPDRVWPGAARNRGVLAAGGDVLLFVDADCVAEPGWVEAARGALEAGTRLAGGPVVQLLPYHPIAVSDNLLQFAEYAAGRPEGPIDRFPACNLAVRRADFEALGAFPEDAALGEDTRFSGTALSRWPDGLRFVPSMRVRHAGRTSPRAFLAHQVALGYARGILRTDLTPIQQRLAAHAVMAPAVALKRLSYILGRTWRWHPGGVPAALVLTPLLFLGLLAFALGLRRALRGGPAFHEPR